MKTLRLLFCGLSVMALVTSTALFATGETTTTTTSTEQQKTTEEHPSQATTEEHHTTTTTTKAKKAKHPHVKHDEPAQANEE